MKNVKTLLFLFINLIFLTVINSFGQGEANVWYTGGGAAASCGLDFNTNPPTILENGANLMPSATGEGAGAICNAAGVLQFYTNGQSIYRANHTLMPSSTGAALPSLNGNPTTTQTGLIIPMNGFPGKYFVVSTSDGIAVKYVIVDMSLFAGLGAVENASLASGNGTTLLAAPKAEGALIIPEFSGANIATGENWVIFHGTADNIYHVFKTNGATITSSATYAVGYSVPGQPVMIMKTNSCFDKIATAFYNNGRVEVLPFNNITGVISAPTLILSGTGGAPFLNSEVYGIEFSPSGQFLYISESGLNSRRTVYQFNISLGTGTNPAAVIATKSYYTLPDMSGGADNDRAGALQLGPDGKIYVPLFSTSPPSYLNVIPTPDVAWNTPTPTATQFEALKYYFGTTRVGEGLPPILRSLLTQVKINYNNACAGGTTNFSYIFGGSAVTTTWDFGDPASGVLNTSTASAPSHTYNTGGTYLVTLTIVDNCGRTHVGTVNVIVKPGPVVTVPSGCANTNITLTGTGINAANYEWSLNSDMSSATGPSSTYVYNGTLPRTIYVEDPTPLSTNTVGNTDAGATAGADIGFTYFELTTTVNIVSFQVKSRAAGTANFSIQNEAGTITYWGPVAYSAAAQAAGGPASTITVGVVLAPGRYRFYTSDVTKCWRNNTDDDGGRDVNGVIDVLGEKSGTKGGNFFNIVLELPDPCGIRAYTITENCVSPVRLLSFYGEEENSNVNLFWDVASELNNDYFLIERSNDGVHFSSIGKVEGRGTSSEYGQYAFIDTNPLAGINYYRLVQTDYDGRIEYSTIIRFEFGSLNINVFPNPFVESTIVAISTLEEVVVEVHDLLGRKVEVVTKKQGEQKVVVGSSLISGTYIIKVIMEGNTFALKIVKD